MTRILVVDDDFAVRQVVSRMLTALGYEVVVTSNGREAIDALSGNGTIDLTLTDLRMPDMHGGELIRWIVRRKPAMRVACMSSAEGECPPGVTFLAKPFTLAEVRDCVSRVLAETEAPIHR